MRRSSNLRDAAAQIVAESLRPNLEGISRTVTVGESGKITNDFRFHNLLDVIYSHLADAVTGEVIKTCAFAGCGRFFIATNLKRKYCPPPKGQIGEGSCATTDRQRKFRLTNPKEPSGRKGAKNYGRQRLRKTKS